MELPVTALPAHLIPAIRLKPGNEFLNLRWHRLKIVLRLAEDGLLGRMRDVRSPLCLPERPLSIRTQVSRPLARDGDLIGSLVGHDDLDAQTRWMSSSGQLRYADDRLWKSLHYRHRALAHPAHPAFARHVIQHHQFALAAFAPGQCLRRSQSPHAVRNGYPASSAPSRWPPATASACPASRPLPQRCRGTCGRWCS